MTLFFFYSVHPLRSPNMYSARLCTPELFNQGWTREGALEMLTWIKYEGMHLLHAPFSPLPFPTSTLAKPCWLLDYVVAESAPVQTHTGAFGGKKGLEVITSLAIESLNINQEGRISLKLLNNSLREVWIKSKFWLRKLQIGQRQFCHWLRLIETIQDHWASLSGSCLAKCQANY